MMELDDLNESELLKKTLEKVKNKPSLKERIIEAENINKYLKRIDHIILDLEKSINDDASFLLTQTNFHRENPGGYLSILAYLNVHAKKQAIIAGDAESYLLRLVKEFRKKNKPEQTTFAKYLRYTCLGSDTPYNIEATCGQVGPNSSQNYDLQRVNLDTFLNQYEIFKNAEKDLKWLFENYSDKLALMTALSAKCTKNFGGDWDELVTKEIEKKDSTDKKTTKLDEEIQLCEEMKKYEEKHNIKIQLMLQAYSEYL